MDLLLAEELLLLSLDDEKGSDQTWSSIDGGLAGALLLDLTHAGALRLGDDDRLVPGGATPVDPLLVDVLEVVRSSDEPRDAKHWVSKLPGELKPLRRLAERLVERDGVQQVLHAAASAPARSPDSVSRNSSVSVGRS